MRPRVDRLRGVAFAALVLLLPSIAPAAAQEIPDIRGTYFTSGAQTIYDCNFQGGEVFVQPFSMFVVVEQQDGSHFSGYLGFPEQQFVFMRVSGNVSAEGELSGTFAFEDVQIDPLFFQRNLSGRVVDGKIELELTGRYGFDEEAACSYRLAVASDSGVLQWSPPDPTVDESELPPPRALTLTENPEAKAPSLPPIGAAAGPARAARRAEPTGYNVYRSTTPNVQTTPENLYTSVPPNVTTVATAVGTGGSFFVVTATYPAGESEPSNEVSGGVAAATLGTVKVTGTKIVAKGTGFSRTVQVFVDGIPFVGPAKVKPEKKVTQKGALLTGQTLSQYITSGKTVAISFRNENGGIATYVHTEP